MRYKVIIGGVMDVPTYFVDAHLGDSRFNLIGLCQKAGFGLTDYKTYDDYEEMTQSGQRTGSSGRKTNGNPVLKGTPGKGNYFIHPNGDTVHSLYARVFIRRKV